MEITKHSGFKDRNSDLGWFYDWVENLELANNRKYKAIEIYTELGKTHVWAVNIDNPNAETIVIFPGARTTSLFWDLDRGLDHLGTDLRIFLVETNGLPNLSDGSTPDIKSNGYGEWAAEVMTRLGIEKAYVAGASFGGLICMKLAITNPEKIKAAFLLNPACLQSFSLKPKNLFYNLLPIFFPTRGSVRSFLDAAVFCKPNHQLSEGAEQLIIDYELFAIQRYHDRAQKPYDMDVELHNVTVPTYLIVSENDLLFPYKKSIEAATEKISTLNDVKVFGNVGHGIETYSKALQYIGHLVSHDRPAEMLVAILEND